MEQPKTAIDEIKAGWVLHSKLGEYVYIGDSGSVISTATRTQVALLPALNNGRHGFLEVMFDATGTPVDTSTTSAWVTRHGAWAPLPPVTAPHDAWPSYRDQER